MNMNKAKAIETLARHAAEAVGLAHAYAVAADQDWAEGSTSFVFDDNSVLVCCGPSFWARQDD